MRLFSIFAVLSLMIKDKALFFKALHLTSPFGGAICFETLKVLDRIMGAAYLERNPFRSAWKKNQFMCELGRRGDGEGKKSKRRITGPK